MSEFTKRIAALSPEKLALLQNRLKKGDEVEDASIPMLSRERDVFPMSFAQKRLWFVEQLQPNSAAYNVPTVMRVRMPLDVRALERSLNEIVARHEVLRTRFVVLDGQPMQAILPSATVPLPVVDLTHVPEQQREMEAQRLAYEEAQRPFNVADGPHIRAHLLRLAEADHVLLLSLHHIAADGWSMGVLQRELAALYEAFAQGKPSPLKPLPIQYADFASFQQQTLTGAVLEGHLAYWKKQLAGAPALLDLPTDRPRPLVQTFRGATQMLAIPQDVTEKLKALSQREGVTLFMTLLSAFAALLHRYSREDDIVIGSPIANRTRAELEGLIGFFTNTLVLRIDMSGAPTFRELQKRVREVTLGAYTHQDLPFEKLVEELQPARNLSHNPLFQVMFVLQNMPAAGSPSGTPNAAPGTQDAAPATLGTAKFDLTLSIMETGQGLFGGLEFNTDLFDPLTIARMAVHFQTLVTGIAADPDKPIWALPWLTDQERQQLLVAWNDTSRDLGFARCIHRIFESQVERAPDAVALTLGDAELSYLELNRRANRLAHALRRLGVRPDDRVAICIERSFEMVIAVLGVFKAGGAYVPLDPAYPTERLSFMLADAQASVLLTQEHLATRLPGHHAKVLYLEEGSAALANESDQNLEAGAAPENLAYVIYTSGSTGRPKGVAIEHRSLCNLIMATSNTFGMTPKSRVLQFASLSFDASIWEIALTLSAGARLCLGTRDSLLPGASLSAFLHRHGITIATLPPSVVAVMSPEATSPLEVLIVGGEACTAEIIRPWLGRCRCFNAYGPTEITVCATVAECRDGLRAPPIGRPLTNTRLYLLDEHFQPVPVGVPGEIYIGGRGLARGYLGRPDLTEERFIPDPWSGEPGARLYKTGDMARYLPDGNIEFLRRADHQIKLRGFRIELGEIEATLKQHSSIRDAVVILREDRPGDKRLVAYLIPLEGQELPIQEVRAHLKEKLPEHMIPSTLVTLGSLPLTPNGKVDRPRLPAPSEDRPELSRSYVAPRNAREQTLADIWAQVLGVAQVGIHDEFFELGGHSLLLTQIASRVRRTFRVDLPLRRLFERPTIAELATALEKIEEREEAPVEGTIPRAPRDGRRIKLPSRSQKPLTPMERQERQERQPPIPEPTPALEKIEAREEARVEGTIPRAPRDGRRIKLSSLSQRPTTPMEKK